MKHFPSFLTTPHYITIITQQETRTVAGEETLSFEDITLTVQNGAVTLQAQHTPIRSVRLRWNFSMPEECNILTDAWERAYSELGWHSYVPERPLPWYFIIKTESTVAGYGVKTNPDACCCFACDPKGITLYMDVRCGGQGVVLQGKTLTCAQLVCEEYQNTTPFDAATAFMKQLATTNITPATPVYGFNNWYYAYGDSDHNRILANTAHLASVTKGLENRPYMVIDDCWQINRRAGYIGGPWRQGNDRFPDMAALAKEMAAHNVLPAIWYRPLQNEDPALPAYCFQTDRPDRLDPSVPETLEYIKEDIRTFVDWGYRLIKHDFSLIDLVGAGGPDMLGTLWCGGERTFADRSKTTAQIAKDLYKAIHDAAEGKALILGCNCAGHLGAGFMELNRTGDDVSGNVWERTRRAGVNTLAFRMPQHGAWMSADADCVGITHNIDWEKNKQWLYLLAHSGTPLFVSVAPDTLNEEQNAFLAQMMAVASKPRPVAVPLDFTHTTCPARWLIDSKEVTFDWFAHEGIDPSVIV